MGCGASVQSDDKDADYAAPDTPAAAAEEKEPLNNTLSVLEPPIKKDPKSVDFRAIHSAVRWNTKPFKEIESLITSSEAANCVDPGDDVIPSTGNAPIHIASQNGHITLVNMLIAKGAKVNVKNKKGNTPLHMALSYDYYECCLALIAAEADLEDKNEAGHAAKFGLDGDKSLPLLALMASKTSADALSALATIKAQGGAGINQSAFASAGLKTKKEIKTEWTDEVQAEFKAILATL